MSEKPDLKKCLKELRICINNNNDCVENISYAENLIKEMDKSIDDFEKSVLQEVLNKLEANRKNIQKIDSIDTYCLEDGYNSAINLIEKRLETKKK